jgi:hypothetical protein
VGRALRRIGELSAAALRPVPHTVRRSRRATRVPSTATVGGWGVSEQSHSTTPACSFTSRQVSEPTPGRQFPSRAGCPTQPRSTSAPVCRARRRRIGLISRDSGNDPRSNLRLNRRWSAASCGARSALPQRVAARPIPCEFTFPFRAPWHQVASCPVSARSIGSQTPATSRQPSSALLPRKRAH